MNDVFKPLATLHGKRTNKTYKFYWHTENHNIYRDETTFFGGTSKEKIGQVASSWEMAYHAAEAYVHDK